MLASAECILLGDLLRQELGCTARLHELLVSEEQAIAARDSEAMQRMVTEIQALLAELDDYHQQHAHLLGAAGLSDDRAGLEAALKDCIGCAVDFGSTWAGLQESLAQCQRQNQVNGRLLASSQHYTQRVLTLLYGGQGEGELYTPEGKTAPGSLGHGRGVKV